MGMQNQTTKNEEYNRWVFVDLEMTGLDEKNCVIVQAAMVITDRALQELAVLDLPIWQPDAELDKMVPFVRDMHTKNGLLQRVRSSAVSVQEAEKQMLELLVQHVSYRKGILAGSSIHFDRRFLQKYMPTFEGYLHYRQIDVSSVKILCQEWFGPKGKSPKKNSTHTALRDIKDTIEELRFYKENCFVASL